MGFRDFVSGLFTRKPSASYSGWRGGIPYTGSKLKGSTVSAYPSQYLLDYDQLRSNSRRNYFESTHARSLIGRLSQNAIGTGLKLSCTPTWEIVAPSWTEEQKQKFTREVEMRWYLWATSHEADAMGKRTLGELQEFEFKNRMKDGETLIILRYSQDAKRLSPLSIQFINPDQIYDELNLNSQQKLPSGNIKQDGIELTSGGEEVAVYIQDPVTLKVQRVPYWGVRRHFVLHPAIIEEIGQVRGVSPIAMLAHELKKLTDYSVAEIEAAINNAVIAGFIKPSGTANSSHALSAIASAGALKNTAAQSEPTHIDKAGVWIQNLKAGEELVSFDTKRPNVNFGAFCDTIITYISAALDIPVEVLKMTFGQNFSASRASLILYWETVEDWRAKTVSQFLQPVYNAWFDEEVQSGRIKAPGYGDSPALTAAWTTTDWIGNSVPSIDPTKEAEADNIRLQQGATTHERIAMKYNGSDFRDNVERLKKENEMLGVEEKVDE